MTRDLILKYDPLEQQMFLFPMLTAAHHVLQVTE